MEGSILYMECRGRVREDGRLILTKIKVSMDSKLCTCITDYSSDLSKSGEVQSALPVI